ncbi:MULTISPECIES: alpha/beta hydrolase [unclassified Mycobacterium]|uniref:putative alpha/beta hydrolase n=1 Tax=unclassified Mycobacterium TaxID=2642494 RepID=UPI000801548B|nr:MULTISPECIES: alpha/beta hydrolase [unclassified Mycobacterium]OBG78718.1 hypothetical protein A5700_15840 [Mycobacterium sp. E1214]OBH27393.1 hypothetical protein A5693_23910 [Mycobacterium sp. E1319]
MQLRHISIPMLIVEAGDDPWVLDASLQAGRPAQIARLAQAFHDAGQSASEAGFAFEHARFFFRASWERGVGPHPIDDATEVGRVVAKLGLQAVQLPRIAVDLDQLAIALAEAQRTSARHIGALEDDLATIDGEVGAGHADIDRLCADAIAETRAIAFQLRRVRDEYALGLQGAVARLRFDGVDPSEVRTVDELLIPPPDSAPPSIASWWSSLNDTQKAMLVAQHPPQLGNLNGIPAQVRDQVNRAVLKDDLQRVESVARQHGWAADSLRDDVLHDRGREELASPESYGLSAEDVARYQNAVRTDQGLDLSRGADPPNARPVLLWAYDPVAFGREGRAAIAIGNPDTARNTAVVVPGSNSSVKGGWFSDGPDEAINLYEQSLRADPSRATAVLAWMGYDAPTFEAPQWDRTLVDARRLTEIGTPWMARQAGAALTADVNGLAATHQAPAPGHVTVLGHSYGATTVADAFTMGMHANDAVLVGCPGTDLASRAADFHLQGGRLYVGAASTDAVSWIGESGTGLPTGLNDLLGAPVGPAAGLGADPAHASFGAVRFRAEVTGSHSVLPWFTDHSHYYDPGSESLHNMTEIVVGRGEALAAEGMTASPRGEGRLSSLREVRTPWGTLRLPHLEIPTPITVDPEWDRADVTNSHGF